MTIARELEDARAIYASPQFHLISGENHRFSKKTPQDVKLVTDFLSLMRAEGGLAGACWEKLGLCPVCKFRAERARQ